MRTALVTGASRGIGRAVALQLAADGYAVAVNYRTSTREAQAVCDAIRGAGGVAQAFPCDISDRASVTAMVGSIRQQLGEITLLVHNAGIAQQKLFTELTDADWRQMMGVHVDGAFYTCQAVLPGMIARHEGGIILLSSMWGQTGGSCEVHYSTAKAALIGMTKALAKEVGPAGVRVNCVAPGVIRTDMVESLGEETLRELEEEAPLCRLGTPEDVAATVSFLAGDRASFITGQIIAPNGGVVI